MTVWQQGCGKWSMESLNSVTEPKQIAPSLGYDPSLPGVELVKYIFGDGLRPLKSGLFAVRSGWYSLLTCAASNLCRRRALPLLGLNRASISLFSASHQNASRNTIITVGYRGLSQSVNGLLSVNKPIEQAIEQ